MDYLYYPEASHPTKKTLSDVVDPTAVVLDFRGSASVTQRRNGDRAGTSASHQAAFGSTACHYENSDDESKRPSNKQRDEIVAEQQFHAFLAVAIVCLLVIVLLVVGLVTTSTRNA
ncbi:transmembrane protein, putative [Bodo saltans]|uniref:Transmembrane protein, putative n=1 Tax=Bodo saltans TaxID=75058 RepID=A0A0S4JK31_BODSA|nr:transmembrane protein, putative [Bodo saltans]|eukprot:CUG90720.1 transmembrane protein, putative [Bodo saltans]